MTWTAVGALNNARQGLALATGPAPAPASGQVLYAIGGDAGANANAIGEVETFTPSSGTWADATTLPPPALTQLAAATLAGQVHVIGGTRGGPVVVPAATHSIFNPATNAWTAGAALTTARAAHAAVTGSDGYIYAIGGITAGGGETNSVERYDPAADAWSPVASMPTPRQGLAACVVGTNIYAIGGQNSPSQALTTVEVFSTVLGTWNAVALPSLPLGRTQLAASAGPGGLIYAIGGLDSSGTPVSDVHSWDQAMSSTWLTVSSALGSTTARLAAALGPDGRLYAVGGNTTLSDAAATANAEVFTTAAAQPQPYITNGTYQSPDIILTDPATSLPVPLGGQPTGPWDTQLTPNTDYPLSARIHNDSGVAAPDTIVRFWHFPGGVGSAGTQLSEVVATIAPGVTTVASSVPFHSGPGGTHECAVVSLSDAQAPFINVDATSAGQVPDPTIPQPGGSGHYASAWRNTDSMSVGVGHIWHLSFTAGTWLREPLPLRIEVTTARIPQRFADTGEAAKLREELRFLGAQPHLPLFLAPRVRSGLEAAPELEITISSPGTEKLAPLAEGEHHELRTSHERPGHFTVHGHIPDDAKVGEAFLVDVGARYPESPGRPASTIRWLEVLYVVDTLRRPHKKGYGD
ncbi:MAG: Kelch repeat-containing protein [Solirubrobacteraceae bacterium]